MTGDQGLDGYFANKDGSGGINGPLDIVKKLEAGESWTDTDV